MSYLGLVGGALGNDLPPLPGHQVEQLVHQERRRHRLHTAARDRDQLPANRAPGKEISCQLLFSIIPLGLKDLKDLFQT